MSFDVEETVELSRRLAARWILMGCLVLAGLITVAGAFLPVGFVLPGLVCFLPIVLAGLAVKKLQGQYCVLVGQAAVAQASGLVAVLSGTGWQFEGHMLFFVALSSLVGLVHVPTIVFAATTIVLHHVVLGIALPHLVFPSVDMFENIQRALFHGALVPLQVFILAVIVRKRLQMAGEMQAALRSSDQALVQAGEAGKQADQARKQAEEEAARAKSAQDKTQDLLKALEAEQEAREQANIAAKAADERAVQEQQARMNSQTQVVAALREGLENIAHGNLTHRIEGRFPDAYEPLRGDFNHTVTNLQAVLSSVAQGTMELMTLVSAVQTSALNLAERTEGQVTSVDATSRALETLNGAVRASTENAQATATSAEKVRDDAESGGEMVHRVVEAMSDIETSSDEIAKINAVMDGIAFQTNLLALNAGVEAARAGEAGRGFSVVASEVRALSLRATEAARSITELTQTSTKQVQSGVALVRQAGGALEEIVSSVSDMTSSVQKIAEATRSQSEQLSEVNGSVSEMDKLAHQNATMFDETNSACTALMDGMQKMVESLAQFTLSAPAHTNVKDGAANGFSSIRA